MAAILRDLEQFKKETIPVIISNTEADGWTHIKTVEDVECSYKKSEDSPFILVKGEGIVDCPVDELVAWFEDHHNFKISDPMIQECIRLEEIQPGFLLCHAKAKMPPMISNRDFVWQEYDGLYQESPRIGVSIVRSVIHEDTPPISGYVRGELSMSGYIIRELEGNRAKSSVTYLVHGDPKGWLPVWVVNLVAGDQAMNVVRVKRHFEDRAQEDKVISLSAEENKPEADEVEAAPTDETPKPGKKTKKNKNKKKKNKKGGK